MDLNFFKNDLVKTRRICFLFMAFSSGLLLVNILLILMLSGFIHRQNTVIVPLSLKAPVLVSTYNVNTEYLADMAQSFVSLRMDFSPKTVDQNHDILKSYIAPSEFATLSGILDSEAKSVKSQAISSSFYVSHIETDSSQLKATVTGSLHRWVGKDALPPVVTTFLVQFSNDHGILKVTDFLELRKQNDDSISL